MSENKNRYVISNLETKKLCELMDIAVNNENCVVFKIKEDTRMDLIALGCFKGTEDMIRMTKGRQPEITIFYHDGSTFSYHFGEGSTTVLHDNLTKQREMIRECVILDFGIVCDRSYMNEKMNDKNFILSTCNVRNRKEAVRHVTLVSGGGMCGHIRINGQHVAHDVHVDQTQDWFKERGYQVEFLDDISNGLRCGRTNGFCSPLEDSSLKKDSLEEQVSAAKKEKAKTPKKKDKALGDSEKSKSDEKVR